MPPPPLRRSTTPCGRPAPRRELLSQSVAGHSTRPQEATNTPIQPASRPAHSRAACRRPLSPGGGRRRPAAAGSGGGGGGSESAGERRRCRDGGVGAVPPAGRRSELSASQSRRPVSDGGQRRSVCMSCGAARPTNDASTAHRHTGRRHRQTTQADGTPANRQTTQQRRRDDTTHTSAPRHTGRKRHSGETNQIDKLANRWCETQTVMTIKQLNNKRDKLGKAPPHPDQHQKTAP